MITRFKWLIALVFVMAVAATSAGPAAAGDWYTYFGPGGTMRQQYLGGPNGAATGYAYWTNNVVYRPLGHPFYLSYYVNGELHSSQTNWDQNPFFFGAYGYNALGCQWEYWNDGSSTLSPVTCQGYR